MLKWDEESRRELIRQWEVYLKRSDEQGAKDQQGQVQEFKACFDAKLIPFLCRFHLKGKVWKEVTNEELMALVIGKPQKSAERLNEGSLEVQIRKKLRMKMHLRVEDRVDALFHDHMCLLEEHGMLDWPEKKGKECVSHILNCLAPPILKEWVIGEIDRSVDRSKAKRDLTGLHTLVLEGAGQVEVFEQLQAKLAARAEGKAVASRKRNSEMQPRLEKKNSGSSKDFSNKKKQRTKLECWHCKGNHPVHKCDTASKEEKDAAIQARKRKEVRRIGHGRDKLYGQLGFKVNVEFCADSGADETLISMRMVEDLQQAGIPVKLKTHELPRTMGLPTQGNVLVVVGHATVDMNINTVGGPLRLRNVHVKVTKEDLAEVLLGHPLLVKLGINVEELLGEVAKARADQDMNQLEEYSSCIRKIGDLQDEYHPDAGDTVEDTSPDIGGSTEEELVEALEAMLQDAESEGAPDGFLRIIREEVFKYKDIF